MSEPISGTAAGVFSWKLIGGLAGLAGVGAGLASYIVMTMSKPRSEQEWHVALISTLISSFCGGSVLIKWLGIESWAHDHFGLISIMGISFACGLPGWMIVRSIFTYIEKKRNADIMEIVREVKDHL